MNVYNREKSQRVYNALERVYIKSKYRRNKTKKKKQKLTPNQNGNDFVSDLVNRLSLLVAI